MADAFRHGTENVDTLKKQIERLQQENDQLQQDKFRLQQNLVEAKKRVPLTPQELKNKIKAWKKGRVA